MFYLSDDDHTIALAGQTFDLQALNDAHYIDETYSSQIPNIFEPDAPIKIIFETVHPSLKENNLIFSQITPEHYFYAIGNIDHHRQLHRHNFYELMFVIEGDMYQNIEHQRHLYPMGSCCLMNKNVYHMEEFTKDYRIVFIDFTSEFITELLNMSTLFPNTHTAAYDKMCEFFRTDLNEKSSSDKSYMDFIPLESPEWIWRNVHHIFESILSETISPTITSELQIRSMFLELLCRLFDTTYFKHTPMHLGSTDEQDLFDSITLYIERKKGRISRTELENEFNYSGDYIYKIIQKYTGLSIFDYSMRFCMKEASNLLISTRKTISQIANDLKFTNLTHFYKIFQREYGMTPKEYRKHHSNSQT